MHALQLLLLEAPGDTQCKAARPSEPAEGPRALFGKANRNATVSKAALHRESHARLRHRGSRVR